MAEHERCHMTGKIIWFTKREAREHAPRGVIRRNVFMCGWCRTYHVGRPRGKGGGRA